MNLLIIYARKGYGYVSWVITPKYVWVTGDEDYGFGPERVYEKVKITDEKHAEVLETVIKTLAEKPVPNSSNPFDRRPVTLIQLNFDDQEFKAIGLKKANIDYFLNDYLPGTANCDTASEEYLKVKESLEYLTSKTEHKMTDK